MDKRETKGIRPGASSGVVRVYSAKRNPFGGYIRDDKSGKDIFVHKSAVEQAGLEALEKDQRVDFDIIEDGFGGFKAAKIKPAG
ncbi:MAG: cold-shock protein [Acidiferrobacterales bacterium]